MEIVWLALKKFCTMYGETGLLIVVLLIGIAVWIYILAGYGIFVSFIKTGEVLLVEEGKKFYRLIPNIPGYGVKDNKIAPLDKGAEQPKSFFGIFWVGFYPLRKIHKYNFSWDKIISKNEIETEKEKGGTIEETNFGIISHRSQIISSLRYKNPYPVILRNMELSGQLKIDIYFDVIFETVDPVFAVFILSGKWLPLATDAFSGIVSDILKQIELRRPSSAKIIATTDPSDNDGSNRYFEEINKETKFNDETLNKNSVILKKSGMIVAEVVYRDYIISGSPEMQKAAESHKVAELNYQTALTNAKATADSTRETKKGEADGIREIKNAEAEGLTKKLEAALKHSQGGDIAIAQEYSGAIRDFQGSTIIFGASNVSPMIPIEQKKGGKKQP